MSTTNNNANADAMSMPPPSLPNQRRKTFRPTDCVSVVSDSSVYAGAMDPVATTLRGLRKALRNTRNAYMSALKQADTLDDDDILDFYQDMDCLRKEVWLAAWRLVNQTRTYAHAESTNNPDKAASLLSTAESSLTEVRKLWDQSCFNDKNTFASHLFLPTYHDIHDESPETGEKRALEMTMGSSTNFVQSLARRRKSTPNTTGDDEDAGEDDLPVGTEAANLNAAEQRHNAPPHTPGAIEDAEEIRINFEPPTPVTPARSRFLSARDDGDDNADDAMETSWPNDDADLPPGAVGGAPPTQDLLNMLQQSIIDGDRNAQGDAMVHVVQRLVNDVNQVRRSVAREARVNTKFRLGSTSVSQQREENARQLTANIALDAAVTARTDAVTAGIDERKRREEEERRKKEKEEEEEKQRVHAEKVKRKAEETRKEQEEKRRTNLKNKIAQDKREKEEKEEKKRKEAERKAEEERRKAVAKRDAEERKKMEEKKRREEKKKEEEKRRNEEEERKKREAQKKSQQRQIPSKTPPPAVREHPLHEQLRTRQDAAEQEKNAMDHADAMARVQQLISDLNLEDSVVLQTRAPPRKSTPPSISSPIIVRQIAGDPPAPQASRNARGSQRLLVDDVFDDEGFERVDRRKSRKTPPPTPSPPTYQRRQTGSDSARNGLAHSQSFAERMNAVSFIDNPIAYDARVRAKDVGLREMRAARPREAYGYLEPIDYIIAKSKFDNAASNIELDEIDKVTELANVFANPAKEIIDGQQLIIKAHNMRRVYSTLWKRLDEMFNTSVNPFQSAVDGICRKGKVPENDMRAHQALIGTLYKLESVAELLNATGECDRDVHIRRIINARVPHISTDYWKASAREQARHGTAYGFQELIEEGKHWVSFNNLKEPTRMAPKPTKVAATAVGPATFKEQLVNSPPKQQPNDICNICGGRHNSHSCHVLEAIPSAEDRVKKLAEKRLCFHCFCPNHSARDCKDKPTCSTCNKKHATLLHNRKRWDGAGRTGEGITFKTPNSAALAAAAAASKTTPPAPPSSSSTDDSASDEGRVMEA